LIPFIVHIVAVKFRTDTGDAHMESPDIIASEAETLFPEKQVEILDFIAFLKVRQLPAEIVSGTSKGTSI
jgi:hypothetical protein